MRPGRRGSAGEASGSVCETAGIVFRAKAEHSASVIGHDQRLDDLPQRDVVQYCTSAAELEVMTTRMRLIGVWSG